MATAHNVGSSKSLAVGRHDGHVDGHLNCVALCVRLCLVPPPLMPLTRLIDDTDGHARSPYHPANCFISTTILSRQYSKSKPLSFVPSASASISNTLRTQISGQSFVIGRTTPLSNRPWFLNSLRGDESAAPSCESMSGMDMSAMLEME
jgi:hypothetical protein